MLISKSIKNHIMIKERKQEVLPFDLSEIKPFVERNIEIPKTELIQRCAGLVNYYLLNMIKVLIFYRIGKDEEGNLYLI